MSEAVFEKDEYSKQRKRKIQPVEDYDPRPPEFRGTPSDRLPALLEEIRGEHLCVSLLFDKKCRHWNAEDEQVTQPTEQCTCRCCSANYHVCFQGEPAHK